MTEPSNNATIAADIGESAALQWVLLQRHLELGSGFALVLMSVPDEEAAATCQLALKGTLGESRRLVVRQADLPVFVYRLPDDLAQIKIPNDRGVLWIESIPAQASAMGLSAEQHTAQWREAWQHVAGRLNERRELLQSQIHDTVIFVGPPALETILRDNAPDLWSVRVLAIHLERTQPKRGKPRPWPSEAIGEWRTFLVPGRDALQLRKLMTALGSVPMLPPALIARGESSDPQLSRIEASRHKQQSGILARRAEVEALLQAAYGFLHRQELVEAERAAREAWGQLQMPEMGAIDPQWQVLKTVESLGATAWVQIVKGDAVGALNSAQLAVDVGKTMPPAALGGEPARRAMFIAYEALGYAAQTCELPTPAALAMAGVSEFADASEQPPEFLALQALGRAQRRLANGEHLEAAERDLRMALRNDALPLGHRARALFWLTACLVQNGRPVEAERAAQRGLLLLESAWPNGVDPNEAPIHGAVLILLARTLVKRDLASAEAVLRSALALLDRRGARWKEYPEPRLLLGMVLMLRGRYPEAERQLQSVLEMQRANKVPTLECRQAIDALTATLFVQSRWDDAEKLLAETCEELRQAGEAELRARLERTLGLIRRLRPRWLFAPLVGAVGRVRGWNWRRQLKRR